MINRSNLHVNNFLQDKNKKNTSREDRLGLTKVVGTKPQRNQRSE